MKNAFCIALAAICFDALVAPAVAQTQCEKDVTSRDQSCALNELADGDDYATCLREALGKLGYAEGTHYAVEAGEPKCIAGADPPAPATSYELTFCNKTRQPTIYLALGTYESPDASQFIVEGWWELKRESCVKFTRPLGQFSSRYFYYFAESGKGNWSGVKPDARRFCIARKRYRRVDAPGYSCKRGERHLSFRQVHVDRTGHTVNFRD